MTEFVYALGGRPPRWLKLLLTTHRPSKFPPAAIVPETQYDNPMGSMDFPRHPPGIPKI